jgi:hypothetical protein
MSRRTPQRVRTFTVQEANATLPLVRAIVSDLGSLAHDVVDRRQRLSTLAAQRPRGTRDLYQEEVAQIEEELENDARRLEEFVQELRDLGVEPKSATDGLVDFPSMMDGRTVYLCWKLGEPEVLHWHELDAGFQGRHPLTAEIGAGDDLSSGSSDAEH